MKIALTVKGVGLGAWLDEDFAHCRHVIIVDDDNAFESWKNPAPAGNGHTSPELMDYLIQEKPDILVTGMISDIHQAKLESQGIKVLSVRKGFVLELLDEARGP